MNTMTKRYLLIFADGGGSHGSRDRLWEKLLQEFSDWEALGIEPPDITHCEND